MGKKAICSKRGLEGSLMYRRTLLKRYHHGTDFKEKAANIQFANLTDDVILKVLSKSMLKEVVRTTVLSSTWKHVWKSCPKLRFNDITICGSEMCRTRQHIHIFTVNAALRQYQGKAAEEVAIKVGYGSLLVDHVNSLVCFAQSSSTKNLALDLVPDNLLKADLYGYDGDSSQSVPHLMHIGRP